MSCDRPRESEGSKIGLNVWHSEMVPTQKRQVSNVREHSMVPNSEVKVLRRQDTRAQINKSRKNGSPRQAHSSQPDIPRCALRTAGCAGVLLGIAHCADEPTSNVNRHTPSHAEQRFPDGGFSYQSTASIRYCLARRHTCPAVRRCKNI